MSPEMNHALAVATRQWHAATRRFEEVSRAFADAQAQLQLAERDLHELARAIEVAEGQPAGELVSNQPAPIGVVTMPIIQGGSLGAAADGVDAAAIVLAELQRNRMGMP